MSKYGRLRDGQDGHSQFFLKATLTAHDESMEHPLVHAIVDKRVTDAAHGHYLHGLHRTFRALEARPEKLPTADARLNRTGAIEKDLHALGAAGSPPRSDATDAYLACLASAQDWKDVLCHHFLQYNALLSGGAFLGGCLKAQGKPRAAYAFELGIESQYVRRYMEALDAIELSEADRRPARGWRKS